MDSTNFPKTPVTLETIAKDLGYITTKIDSFDKKFDSIDAKFNSIDSKFDSIDTRFNSIDSKFDSLDKKVDSLDIKIEKSIEELAAMTARGFNEVTERFRGVEKRLDEIEENMATKDDISRLEGRFDGLEKVIYHDHGKRLRKIETKLQLA